MNEPVQTEGVAGTAWRMPLIASDRCDRCGAQAYARATLASGAELLFCAHHGRENLPAILTKHPDAKLYDESNRLQEEVMKDEASIQKG